VQGLAAATVALGHDVHVYTSNVDGVGVSDVPTLVPVDLDGVKVWYFPSGRGRRIFRSPELGHALYQTISSFDIVHIHYVWVWTTIQAAAAARRHSVPYVLAPRGMLVEDLIRQRSSLAKRAWLTLFGRRDVANAAAIHVTSDAEAAALHALGLSPRRVVVIPNGIDPPNAACEALVRRESNISDGALAPYILFLGRISWKKGLDRLLRALPAVNGVNLVVAGYDEHGYQAAMERLAVDCGVGDQVRFVGPVEGAEKWRLICQARCLVLPSYNENFGMVVLEAMAIGVPVVVTSEVGLSDVVARAECGIVTNGNPDALAEALSYIIRNPAKAHSMGAAGRRVVRERFSWQAVAQEAVSLYEQCLNKP